MFTRTSLMSPNAPEEEPEASRRAARLPGRRLHLLPVPGAKESHAGQSAALRSVPLLHLHAAQAAERPGAPECVTRWEGCSRDAFQASESRLGKAKPSFRRRGCLEGSTRGDGALFHLPVLPPSTNAPFPSGRRREKRPPATPHRALNSSSRLQTRKGAGQDPAPEIPHPELGRDGGSARSGRLDLGRHRHVSHFLDYPRPSPGVGSHLPSLLPRRRSDSSYSLLADDVLGSYLLCPHPKKSNHGSLVVRVASGLVTHLVENTRKGKFLLEVTGDRRSRGGRHDGLVRRSRNPCRENPPPGSENVKLISAMVSNVLALDLFYFHT